jgi:Ca-activated chloride channel family protein
MTRPLPQLTDEELDRATGAGEVGFGSLATPRGHLPLKAMDVRGRIDGLLAQLSVRQMFVNALDEPVEATYIFPLPDRAAVRGFRMELTGRIIDGVLEERAKARENYDKAIAAGHHAAIAEEERPGVFTLRVGNLMPGEQATVQLDLAGVLPYCGGEVTFRFPLVVAPRYIPGMPLPGPSVGDGTAVDTDSVPDASRISPPVLLPGFKSPVRLSLTIDLHDHNGNVVAHDIRSSLHSILTEEKEGCLRVRLQPGDRLDRDFILRFRLGSRDPARAIASTLTLHPDSESNGRTGSFALTLVPPEGAGTLSQARDVVFVLDRSGSMQGWKIVAARRALARMVDTLGERDRFAVLAFDNVVETPHGLASDLVSATDRNRFRALEYLAKVEARGGTEMAGPLLLAADRLLSEQSMEHETPAREELLRDAILVLVTDGQVGNEDQILQALEPRLASFRVFTLGIDRAVNEGFLRRLAELGRGRCELVESENRLDEVMAAIHRQIGTPLLSGLSLVPEGFSIEPDSLVPERLPDLFPGAPLLILGRFQGQPIGQLAVRARDAAGHPWSETIETRLRDNPAIASAWARGQVRKLEDRYVVGTGNLKELGRQIVAVSLRFGVLCRFTAFTAIDRQQTANKSGELHRIMQPVEMPEGWATGEFAALGHRVIGEVCMSPERVESRGGAASFGLPLKVSDLAKIIRSAPARRSRKLSERDLAPPPPSSASSPDDTAELTLSKTTTPSPVLPDRYQARTRVAIGAQGSIIEAFDKVHGRTVLLHTLANSAQLPDPAVLAPIIRSLQHHSLLAVLDVFRDGNRLVFVTATTGSGRSLDEIVRHRKVEPQEAARWVIDCALAIQHASDQGLHCFQLLPGDVWIRDDGHVLITDLVSWLLSRSGPAGILGNPSRLAPELLEGPAVVGDSRSAVYALGVLLYEVLTGELPFRGDGAEVIRLVLQGRPRPPRSIRRSIPADLETICLKAMARKPEDRYATPGEMAQALRQFIVSQPEQRKGFWKRK